MRKLALLAAAVAVILAVALPLSFRFLGSDEGASAQGDTVDFDIDPDISGNTASSIGAGGVEDCLRVDVAPEDFGDGVADVTIDVVVQGDTLAPLAYDAYVIYEPTKVNPVTWNDRIKLPGAMPATTKAPPQLNAGALYLAGGAGTPGDGTLVRIDLDVVSAGVATLTLSEPPGTAYASEAGDHPTTTGAAVLAINEDCPRAPPAPPAGPSPTPAEAEPTSDLFLEWERARQEEEAKPRFEGVVNGIRLYPTNAEPAVYRESACNYVKSEEREYVTMSEVAGTPMEITPTYLPTGAEETSPMWPPMICKGILASVERQWVIRDEGARFFIARRQGEHAADTTASADRISAATIGGKPAVLVEPITPDGYGHSMVIVAEDFGITVIVAFGLPLEETVKIAEGLY